MTPNEQTALDALRTIMAEAEGVGQSPEMTLASVAVLAEQAIATLEAGQAETGRDFSAALDLGIAIEKVNASTRLTPSPTVPVTRSHVEELAGIKHYLVQNCYSIFASDTLHDIACTVQNYIAVLPTPQSSIPMDALQAILENYGPGTIQPDWAYDKLCEALQHQGNAVMRHKLESP